jgi:enoyl-CoA hydratase/carnithine racemase
MRLGSVNYETRGKVAILTLDEPAKLNALSAGIRSGILEGLKKADADEAIRVAIIAGSGDRAFCAGADIGDMDFDPERARSFLIAALEVLAAPENTRKPVISAINGIAYGGGFELAMASDFIIASDRARFAVPEIKLGLLPGFAIVRLADIVGREGKGIEHARRSDLRRGGLPAQPRVARGPAPKLAVGRRRFRGANCCKATVRGAIGKIVLQPRSRR